ncbi:hypothetical protein M2189_001073 [Bradyrhizobium japonicum]|nr:hypothetical protein [Bradyrhizobium japonicum]MCS3957870.1 hypothetical protein [Bradyrhizobium japonicum]MCS3999622.1 hypothetical protein [Bradyrhizobium japonicum]
MTKDGVIVIHAQRYRTQERNRQDAIDRLVEILKEAMVRPTPCRATRPTFASKQRGKKRRSDIKAKRGRGFVVAPSAQNGLSIAGHAMGPTRPRYPIRYRHLVGTHRTMLCLRKPGPRADNVSW